MPGIERLDWTQLVGFVLMTLFVCAAIVATAAWRTLDEPNCERDEPRTDDDLYDPDHVGDDEHYTDYYGW